ncbi:MAG: HAD hydrolase-like protein [Prochlorococcaceae cyanobacterium]
MNITKYKTLIFDCDGVILDSNKIKSEAFYRAALPFGEEHARFLVGYHQSRGGISRFEKFRFFLFEYLAIDDPSGELLEELLNSYAKNVMEGLLTCACTPGLSELRKRTPDAKWMVVSGGKQDELREVFAKRKLEHFFDAGIFGSPDSKDDIVKREIDRGTLLREAVFFGDSKYDYYVASRFNLEFIFISHWTEMPGWEAFCRTEGIVSSDFVGAVFP